MKRSNEILKSILNNHVDEGIDSDSDAGEYEATDFNSELHIEECFCFAFILRI